MKGIPLLVSAQEIDAFNECLTEFKEQVKQRCSTIRIVGLIAGAPNLEGTYGLVSVVGPNVSYAQMAQIFREMGTWMESQITH